MAEDRLEAVTDLAMVADRAEEAMVEDMVAAVALVALVGDLGESKVGTVATWVKEEAMVMAAPSVEAAATAAHEVGEGPVAAKMEAWEVSASAPRRPRTGACCLWTKTRRVAA